MSGNRRCLIKLWDIHWVTTVSTSTSILTKPSNVGKCQVSKTKNENCFWGHAWNTYAHTMEKLHRENTQHENWLYQKGGLLIMGHIVMLFLSLKKVKGGIGPQHCENKRWEAGFWEWCFHKYCTPSVSSNTFFSFFFGSLLKLKEKKYSLFLPQISFWWPVLGIHFDQEAKIIL